MSTAELLDAAKPGIVVASVVSAAGGLVLLARLDRHRRAIALPWRSEN